MCSTPNPVYAQQKVPDWEKASHPGTFAISQRMHSWTMIQKCTYVHCTYEEAFLWSSFLATPVGTDSNSVQHIGPGMSSWCLTALTHCMRENEKHGTERRDKFLSHIFWLYQRASSLEKDGHLGARHVPMEGTDGSQLLVRSILVREPSPHGHASQSRYHCLCPGRLPARSIIGDVGPALLQWGAELLFVNGLFLKLNRVSTGKMISLCTEKYLMPSVSHTIPYRLYRNKIPSVLDAPERLKLKFSLNICHDFTRLVRAALLQQESRRRQERTDPTAGFSA